jgi:hypothetical protein
MSDSLSFPLARRDLVLFPFGLAPAVPCSAPARRRGFGWPGGWRRRAVCVVGVMTMTRVLSPLEFRRAARPPRGPQSRRSAEMSDPESTLGRVEPDPVFETDPIAVELDPEPLIRFLRRRHPRRTPEAVAAQSGLPPESVRRWLKGGVWPSGRAVVALVANYGPELIAGTLKRRPPWRDEAARRAARLELRRQSEALRLEAEALARRLEALRD